MTDRKRALDFLNQWDFELRQMEQYGDYEGVLDTIRADLAHSTNMPELVTVSELTEKLKTYTDDDQFIVLNYLMNTYPDGIIIKTENESWSKLFSECIAGAVKESKKNPRFNEAWEIFDAEQGNKTDAERCGEWPTIDSAPRDGTKILGIEEDGNMIVCWFDEFWVREGDVYNHCAEPVRWMPIPQLPKER